MTALIKYAFISVNCIEGFILQIILGVKPKRFSFAVNYDAEFNIHFL